ncbi:MAG: type II secretion system protein GspM [Betaproteobacteria bacterium]
MTKTSTRSWIPNNPRDRRIMAVTILALVVALIVAAIVVPVVMLNRHYDQNIARMTRQWKNQSAFNELRPQVTRALDQLKSRDVRKLFLKGTTVALGSAELQDHVAQVIEGNGGRLIARNVSPHKDDGPYRLVSANFAFNISNVNLRRMMHALETREPYLFNDNLMIRSQIAPGYRLPVGAVEPDLYVSMDVSSVAYVGSESAPATAGVPASAKPVAGGKS